MKKLLIISALSLPFLFINCKGDSKENNSTTTETEDTSVTTTESSGDPAEYDPTRGEGKFDASNVNISGFDAEMAAKGKAIAEVKCFSCHKTTDERLVGPGWKGVTERRSPHWIMNFVTNPDPMIDKDPEVQAQLEICLVRMPNQNIADDEARAIVEFMREVDGAK